jgi:hypothetical protein
MTNTSYLAEQQYAVSKINTETNTRNANLNVQKKRNVTQKICGHSSYATKNKSLANKKQVKGQTIYIHW